MVGCWNRKKHGIQRMRPAREADSGDGGQRQLPGIMSDDQPVPDLLAADPYSASSTSEYVYLVLPYKFLESKPFIVHLLFTL